MKRFWMMIRWMCLFSGFLAVWVHANWAAQDVHLTRTFLAAVGDYEKGDYKSAIEGFLKISESGVQNGALFYNLGNAYFKADDIGRAILWFERAKTLMPSDPDLEFNLSRARSLTRDQQDEDRSPVLKALFFWVYLFSVPVLKWMAISVNVLFWGLMALHTFIRKSWIKHLKVACGVFSLILILTVGVHAYANLKDRTAIILPDQVSVRSGLSDTSTELFVLHAGTWVMVTEEKEGYCRIQFSKDKIGWLPLAQIGKV
jgi:hypothetical protein